MPCVSHQNKTDRSSEVGEDELVWLISGYRASIIIDADDVSSM